MLEGLVAWVLNNYLGKYVENLNTDQLSIALLSGEVELENLPLKKDALRHFGLPVVVNAGFIGKIKLQIPVRQIRSAPWVIIIEQLYVVASPLPINEWDPLVEEQAAQDLKLEALDDIEARWRIETESKDSTYYASTYSSWLNFGTGLITDIMENLQLKILDVNIRYEDSFSISNEVIGFGITMDYLSVQSCDSNWVPGFSHWNSSTESFKLMEMHKLAIYWMTIDHSQLFSKLPFDQLMNVMSPSKGNGHVNHYLLSPVSAQAHFKRNRSEQPLRSSDTPRIVCDLHLQEVPLTLVEHQYEQMVKCVKGLEDITRLRSFRRFRPVCPVKEDARAWWLYAISCLYPGGQPAICKPRPTWVSCLERARQNVEYVKLYVKVLTTPPIALSPESKKIKDTVEWIRDYEELKVLREIAMRSVPLQQVNNNGSSTGRNILLSWFPQWMGWYSSSNSETNTSSYGDASQLEGELLEALKDSAENNTILKRDAVFGQFHFSLRSGALRLCTSKSDSDTIVPMLELQFKNLSLKILSRPRLSSYLIELSLGGLFLHDKLTPATLFPVLVGPPGQERLTQLTKSKGSLIKIKNEDDLDALFYLAYERKPEDTTFDHRLHIRSKSLDVIYQPSAVKWLIEFLSLPHQRAITQMRIEEVKIRTKKELIKNWEQILDGRTMGRKNWELHLDISAPQIIFVEQFTDANSAMAVIDFGRLQLQNAQDKSQMPLIPILLTKESEEDDMFMTPCSTPPGSEASISETLYLNMPENADTLNEQNLHRKLYDRYCVELTDLQILVGRIKDNWRYAHNRGTSSLHILDRFNISLQIEHRIVHTCDPLYPSLTISANLPKLVAHINEQKIAAARGLIEVIKVTGLPSPFNTPDSDIPITTSFIQEDDESISLDTSVELSRLLILQFTVDHLALEVQSRGRSISELQVTGVKAAFSKRPVDVSITLSVHSLLLVDALQTFGPDFELLVASHKHVGMDSVSGSIRDSEPTSPTSPGSPDPNQNQASSTSPVALTQALNVLSTSPTPHSWQQSSFLQAPILDAEALITIEVILVNGAEPMHIANIQFNNLDIIANQETIVELIGFAQRVFPELKRQKQSVPKPVPLVDTVSNVTEPTDRENESPLPKMCRTELTFDFHRLTLLLLRGVLKDDGIHGRKIATATMSEAKIHITVDNGVVVEGSLGGLQVLDLTPEGHLHQRIISVGRDTLLDVPHPLYIMSQSLYEEERKAFSFKVERKLSTESDGNDSANVTIRMASVWYTHSPQFLLELQSCATEFKQYLANLARSIRSAATDMALGLVHARAEALVQSLYINNRISASLYGSALSLSDIMSPRRRSRHSSFVDHGDGPSGYSSVRDTVPQTPYSPIYDDNFVIDMKLDIVLDSPVVVLPRAANSPQVFVAHLGKTSVSNRNNKKAEDWNHMESRLEYYSIEIRNMNLFSLDTSSRRVPGPTMNKAETLYSCETLAKPILHDTVVQLTVEREIYFNSQSRHHSISNLLDDDNSDLQTNEEVANFNSENIEISGSVITALKVSITRLQYEQLLDTFQWFTFPSKKSDDLALQLNTRSSASLANISEEDTGVTTLKMDPQIRAKLFPTISAPKLKNQSSRNIALKVLFELPVFTVELRGDSPTGERGFVDLSFQEFVFNYEHCHRYETSIQVSLRSVVMEDLLQPEGSRRRDIVVSSSGTDPPTNLNCISRSCPNAHSEHTVSNYCHGSLPDLLEPAKVLGVDISNFATSTKAKYPSTPPPSPSNKHAQKNLVLISSILVDPLAPNFHSHYNSIQRSTSVDFNCLDLVISVESWVVLIDFFSAVPTASTFTTSDLKVFDLQQTTNKYVSQENTETNIAVHSLSVTLVRSDRDIAKANVSMVDISIKSNNLCKEIEGQLGSMSLLDLTLQGQLYKERFLTSGEQALHFKYTRFRPGEMPDFDAQLNLKMSSVFYVHTKRFIIEIQAFFHHFTQLQAIMQGIRVATGRQKVTNDYKRLSIVLQAGAPVILLPVSSRSSDVLIADLGQLSLTNCFKYSGDLGTISVMNPHATDKKCLLDVMSVDLYNVDLYSGIRVSDYSSSKDVSTNTDSFKCGTFKVNKVGSALLTEKCRLKIQIERNLNSDLCHSVADMSVHGKLSTLDVALDLSQYLLIKNLLTYNLGENTEHILPSVLSATPLMPESCSREVWTLTSLKFDLLNVILRLQIKHGTSPLARINFIKSRLTVELFSNLSQDVDLVSQEILVMDTRFQNAPANKRCNVFTNILQPINFSSQNEIVQAEIHSRKRQDRTKFTILLNNMRLMAVFDWWDTALKFILEDNSDVPASPRLEKPHPDKSEEIIVPFELKLNITDSEIIVVEDTSRWDANAVIFKSTTVLSYKPYASEKPLSCNLNNCEMYSCILGMEDETALSIIDPVTLNMEINKDRVLEMQLQLLTIRLSYHDMRLFLRILNSLPKQMLGSKNEQIPHHIAIMKNKIIKLSALGFQEDDCIKALELCNMKLDDAALWLTQNAIPASYHSLKHNTNKTPLYIVAVEVKADCISLCVIDDCGDADVPLLEISLAQLNLRQRIGEIEESEENDLPVEGALECKLSGDYYNRILSGWEPIVEQWRCAVVWDHVLTSTLSKNRLQLNIESQDILNINITSSFMELYKQVRDNWIQDYYNNRENSQENNRELETTSNYKRRSPFVPFALKNECGLPLYFTTLISDMDFSFNTEQSLEVTDRWVLVAPGETVPFSFRTHDKKRHGDSHRLRMHQLGVKIEGWKTVPPVTVDKVGIYFQHTSAEIQHRLQQISFARIVFDVSLEGSARKLVTVRSSLLIRNKLQGDIEIKLENTNSASQWTSSKSLTLQSKEALAIPLTHVHSLISARPLSNTQKYTYSQNISWGLVTRSNDSIYELKSCSTPRDPIAYRFCAEIKKENYQADKFAITGHSVQPAHVITFFPVVLLVNLLPTDLSYNLMGKSGRVAPGNKISITHVDTEQVIELKLCLENFPISSSLIVPAGCVNGFSCRIRFEDSAGRRLFLQAFIVPFSDARIKVTISAPYWIINKTGLPLVFRQRGVSAETAGQFEEHEVARMIAPLLFSFTDPDGSPSMVARVGNAVVSNGNPQWCQDFDLQRGVKVRKLRASLRDGRPDVVFLIGIEVRTGKGKYRYTNIVTISPRFQLHNRSSYRLLFSQSYLTSTVADPLAETSYLEVIPKCHMPYHWKRHDRDQLLSVLIRDIPNCCWSGGFKIDKIDSMHLNIRDTHNRMYFLRLEIVLQGATFFVVFTDADTMPPPIRVDNFSEVPITFAQNCCKEITRSIARAHTSVPYAWDQPTGPSLLNIVAPGGISSTYDMNKLGPVAGLTYENFIYIAFTGTYKNGEEAVDPLDVESQQLVLDVIRGNQVVLAHKQPGQRSQLWRMTAAGQLQHEGSSPPSHPHQPRSENILVLDIEGPAPQPNSYTRLMLRRPDSRRRSTQTWRFTEEGRLCCAHYNMCVQAQDGFFGLRQGNAAVLGLPQPICHKTTNTGIPLEQAVCRQRLRPGSGLLSMEVITDGPTRVLVIRDLKEQHLYATSDERDWCCISLKQRPNLLGISSQEHIKEVKEMQFTMRLTGIGISLISRQPYEELLFTRFTTIVSEVILTSSAKTLCVSVKDVQCDNQMFDASVPVVLYVTPPSSRSSDEVQHKLPALEISFDIQSTPNENAVIFKHLMVRLKKLTINLEEKLVLKLCAFFKAGSKEDEVWNSNDESDFEAQRLLMEVSAAHVKRYYFGIIQLVPNQIRLSMKTANKLPHHLQLIKRKLGFTFIKFEDAAVELEPFVRKHIFETSQILNHSVIKHFKDELVWQAGIILGSTDFLGNPIGFVNDVTEGVSGLIYEGSVGALVKNVTHGISNSAAKVTESLSDGLGRVSMDEEHEEMRQRIRQVESGRSGDHILAGIKGLGFGILGGATGIFKQVYEGASNEGIQGVFSGFGKGIVGAVTKPVVGVLDLASETARAVRDSSRSSSRIIPDRIRPPRCVVGPGGLLPCYSYKQSQGQQYLYIVNNRNYTEQLVAYEYLRSGTEDLRIIVSSERIRIVTGTNGHSLTTVLETHLSDLLQWQPVTLTEGSEIRHYIEITMRVPGTSAALVYLDPVKKPRIRCDSMELSHSVSQQLSYAKKLYNDRIHTLNIDNITQIED